MFFRLRYEFRERFFFWMNIVFILLWMRIDNGKGIDIFIMGFLEFKFLLMIMIGYSLRGYFFG